MNAVIQEKKTALRILVTAGGTREYLDHVRYIANFSSGTTGAVIADHFAAQGHEVTFVHAADAVQPRHPMRRISFASFTDLRQILEAQLAEKTFNAVIHAAAVSDYGIDYLTVGGKVVAAGHQGKLSSEEPPVIHLKLNPKLIAMLKSYAPDNPPLVVGFKLTSTADKTERLAAVTHLLARGNIDYVVLNDLSEIDPAANRHLSAIYDAKNQLAAECETKEELARQLEIILQRSK